MRRHCLALSRPDEALQRKRRLTAWLFLFRAPASAETGEAWAKLDFSMSVQVTVPFESTGLYDFTGEASCSVRGSTSLAVDLPLGTHTSPSLSSTETMGLNLKGRGLHLEIQILDAGSAVNEHESLSCCVADGVRISCYIFADQADVQRRKSDKNVTIGRYHALEILLLSFSNSHPHPLAKEPVIIASINLTLSHRNV